MPIMNSRFSKLLGCLAAAVITLFAASAFAQKAPPQPEGPQAPKLEEYTPAQRLLYATNHLKMVSLSDVLSYRFQRQGSLETPFDDKASLTVSAVGENGKKTLDIDFLTGDRHIDMPPMVLLK